MSEQTYIAVVGEKDKGLLEINEHLGYPNIAVQHIPTITKVGEALGKALPKLIIHNLKSIPDSVLLDKIASVIPHPKIPILMLYKNSRELKPSFITDYPGAIEYICLPVPFEYLIHKANKLMHQGIPHKSEPGKLSEDQTERELFKEKLSQSQNLTLLGQLASGVAHDFNNILGGILGYAEMAKFKFGQKNPSLEKYTDSIISFSKRAGDLTKIILSFASGSKKKKQNLNMHNILVEVIDMLFHTIDKRYQLRRSFHATQMDIVGDPALIQNAIINLCLNARDAMTGGGVITFTTENIKLKERDIKKTKLDVTPGSYFLLSIADTGPGIPKKLHDKIFEPFFTTKEKGKGTGLGLPSVLATIQDHSGALSVESKTNIGTTFHMYIPCGSLKAEEDTDMATQKIPTLGGNILLVDDEDGFRELIREMLTDFGYNITLAGDGQEALEYYRENTDSINLAIIDMNLPRLSGLECFREMKKINPNIRAILCTGINISEDTINMAEEGIMDFIQKPFEMKRLLKVIANVLNPESRWLRKNR